MNKPIIEKVVKEWETNYCINLWDAWIKITEQTAIQLSIELNDLLKEKKSDIINDIRKDYAERIDEIILSTSDKNIQTILSKTDAKILTKLIIILKKYWFNESCKKLLNNLSERSRIFVEEDADIIESNERDFDEWKILRTFLNIIV